MGGVEAWGENGEDGRENRGLGRPRNEIMRTDHETRTKEVIEKDQIRR